MERNPDAANYKLTPYDFDKVVCENDPQQATRESAKASHKRFLKTLDLTMESARLQTFSNWPIETSLVLPKDLARTGFYHLGILDRVQCFSCGTIISTWAYGDIAENVHRENSPMCKMVRGIEAKNKPISSVADDENERPAKKCKFVAKESSSNQVESDPVEENLQLQSASTSNPHSANFELPSTSVNDERQDILIPQDETPADRNEQAGGRFVLRDCHVGHLFVGSTVHVDRTGIDPRTAVPDMAQQDLQNKLKERARAAVSGVGPLTNLRRSITPVSLEITTNLKQAYEDPDDIGHGHRRADFLTILDQPEGDVLMQDLFQRAKSQAEIEAPQEPESREIYLRNHGNCVGVIGQAGIGKTTLTKMFTKLILDNSIPSCDYIFYIPIRNVNFNTSHTNVLEFLVTSSGCEWAHSLESDKILIKLLENNPNVVIAIDGLDEAPIVWAQPSHKVSIYRSASAEDFIKNLLSGEILQQAKKLVTSRPRQFYDMHEDYRPEFIVNIMGLKKESQKSLCRKLCSGQNESDKVLGYLENHPSLFAYCYVPVNCIITMYCIQRSFQEYVSASLDSITSILAFALERFCRTPHIRETTNENTSRQSSASIASQLFAFKALCLLAWNGFKNRKIIFKEDDLSEVNIGKKMLNAFLQTDINIEDENDFRLRIFDDDKRSYFSHLIWHEMFVAVNLMFFMPLDEFRLQMPKFDSIRWENVTKFMYGISNAITMRRLQKIFIGRNESPVDLAQKQTLLNHFAVQCLPALMENDSTPALLRVFDWANESQIVELKDTITENLPEEIRIRGSLHSSDVSKLSYILRSTNKHHIIKVGFGINMIRLTGDSFQRFFEEMKEILRKPNLKLTVLKIFESDQVGGGMGSLCRCLDDVEELVLFSTHVFPCHLSILAETLHDRRRPLKHFFVKFTDDEENNGARALASCAPCIESLHIRFSEISAEGYGYISEGIRQKDVPMKQLNLRGNVIDDRGAYALSTCLTNVDSLNFEGNEITGPGAEHIARAIQSRELPVEMLKLDRNKIGDVGGIALSNCLRNIQRLHLRACDLSSVGVATIARSIQQLHSQKMELLDLSANRLNEQDVRIISSCLKNVKRLILINCSISSAGARIIADSLQWLSFPIETLKLGFNQIGDEGVKVLSNYLNNVELLDLSKCGVSSIGVKAICDAIERLLYHRVSLVLDMNEIGNNGAEKFSSSLKKIKSLSLRRCGITEAGAKKLSDGLNNLQCPLEELNLWENRILNNGVIELTRSLKNVNSLIIKSCGITAAGAKALKTALNALEGPMEVLKLNGNKIGDEGALALSTCLTKVNCLDITQCGISEGFRAMAAAIKNFPFDASGVTGLYAQ
ncbi:NACHT, LRR and PYD domains-containing protein 3-like isoform X3 [Clavelina lepadiformis]|uniref:NACHT, LRR and PYD domains-containing protein 3-like isoform X3 n=1 Tax=Clavelina lepadiformis TaxID=159417 RepID=UPI004041664C